MTRVGVLLLSCAAVASAQDWPMYLYDVSHSSVYTGLTQISVDTAPQLRQIWKLSLGRNLAAAPTVVGGKLYFGDWSGNFYAVRASDGRILWKQYVGKSAEPEQPACGPALGVSSQAVVLGNTVYVGGGDSAIYALEASSGRILWRVPLADPASASYLWSSLVPWQQSLYVGIASLADCPLTTGALVRIDLGNPASPVIRYLTTPDNPGAGIWSTPAIDAFTNTVYVTTGNGDEDPASGTFGSAFMALDAGTLETKSYYFLTFDSTELGGDIEWGSSPTLFQLSDGTPLVAATGKDGGLYALKRSDLTLAWELQVAVGCVCPECGCGSVSTPAFDGTLLYVGAGVPDQDSYYLGSLYAIDPDAGEPVWMQGLPAPVIAPVTVANGVLFCPTAAGLFAFNAQTGDPLWSDGNAGVIYSQAVIADGILYTTYFNGDVVAWTVAEANLL